MTYAEKLKDPRWQKKRLEVFANSHWHCQLCGDTQTTLHVHHCKYDGRDPWEYPMWMMITLCEKCHSQRHGKPAPGSSDVPKPLFPPIEERAYDDLSYEEKKTVRLMVLENKLENILYRLRDSTLRDGERKELEEVAKDLARQVVELNRQVDELNELSRQADELSESTGRVANPY